MRNLFIPPFLAIASTLASPIAIAPNIDWISPVATLEPTEFDVTAKGALYSEYKVPILDNGQANHSAAT